MDLLDVRHPGDIPAWLDIDLLARFLHDNMKPYEDTIPDARRALEYAFSDAPGMGGFVLVAAREEQVIGSVVILDTGMAGYVPEHLLVFVGVRPSERGRGIGGWLVKEAIARCPGAVRINVEYDNPAKRLYERIGFTTKYAEMRYPSEESR